MGRFFGVWLIFYDILTLTTLVLVSLVHFWFWFLLWRVVWSFFFGVEVVFLWFGGLLGGPFGLLGS